MPTTDDLDQPIILVGTHRSGTTFLGAAFARHPDVAYWVEPRHVWTRGHGYRPDDVLGAADATAGVARRIRRTFERFVRRHGRTRLCEKTPSNCLRLPFIRAIYPGARMIHIVRDGRAVIRSTDEILHGGVQKRLVLRRALSTPLWEWPAQVPRACSMVWRRLRRRPLEFWGPRPPGWRDWVRSDPRPVVLAKQWSATVERALDDGRAMDPALYREIRYEQFVTEPRATMESLLDFAGLARDEATIAAVADRADPTGRDRWREAFDDATLAMIRPHLEPTLGRLGYAW